MSTNNYQAKSFEIKQVLLTPVGGTPIDIRLLFIDLNIHEDLFDNFCTGTMTLLDANNLIKKLPIFGFETVDIAFSTPNKLDYLHTFKVYSIKSRELVKERAQVYTLNLISPEAFTNHQNRVSKSYKGKPISDIVTDLQENFLSSGFVDIEPTKYLHHIVLPNILPMEAIRWLSVRSNASNFPGSNYMYFENQDGYNFVPIEKLVRKNKVQTYHSHPGNVFKPGTDQSQSLSPIEEIIVGVESYKFTNHIDSLDSLMKGMYGNRLITHNIIRKRMFTQDFSYTDTWDQYQHLEPNNKKNELLGFTGKTFLSDSSGSLDIPDPVLRFYPSGQLSEEYPNQVENWIQERISRLQQIHNIKLMITVPGDSERKIGEVFEFRLPSPEPLQDNNLQMDTYYQGRYLITSLRHVITKQEYTTDIEGTKDSVFNPLP